MSIIAFSFFPASLRYLILAFNFLAYYVVCVLGGQVLGPDVSDIDYVAYTCDQDAYAYSGQKCSAQSALFAHSNWVKAGLLDKLKTLVARRSISDSTIVPVLTVTNDRYALTLDSSIFYCFALCSACAAIRCRHQNYIGTLC